jgi:HNH endonuclease
MQVCSEASCDRPVRARGLCQQHYTRQRLAGKRCSIEDCERSAFCRGLCRRHYLETRAREKANGEVGMCGCGCGQPTRISTTTDPRRKAFQGRPRRFLPGHNMKVGLPPEYRVVKLGFPTACWIWQRAKAPAGYGAFHRAGRVVYAHRDYYERFKGPIPAGWVVHHLCWNKACVNPEHLEAATMTANNQGCINGPECTEARDRWIPRKRGKYLRLKPGELPYEIKDLGWDSPCWIWRRPLGKGGYPRMRLFGKDTYAHRVFFEFAKGAVPAGLVLDHLCNQPACVCPEHLEAVTQRENLRRKIARQRELTVQRFRGNDRPTGRSNRAP